ncbi:hypothetical protein V6N11_027217 [Hibiscus sabdariffa]|uniref:Uncharacterized protein n=1 Tax=Hibiscus sabdariffa TaxID=183260 RepID=A0ABR2PGT2_9ROSI
MISSNRLMTQSQSTPSPLVNITISLEEAEISRPTHIDKTENLQFENLQFENLQFENLLIENLQIEGFQLENFQFEDFLIENLQMESNLKNLLKH